MLAHFMLSSQASIARNMKVTVIIKRNKVEGSCEVIKGNVKDETNSHYLVTHDGNKDRGEWFAKKSEKVNCILS